ncbi:MAG: MFS transporter, partial [Prevotellaceae bacterium]|nr:MFS transporter [Prevotellaceae bacterium]
AMFLHDYYNYDMIFNCAITACSAGLGVGYFIKAPKKPKTSTAPISLDRFILVKGLRSGLSLMLLGIPYAMTTSYVAIFAKELNLMGSSALFFTFLAIGLIASRFFSGRQVDKGSLTKMIAFGTMLVAISFCLLGSLKVLLGVNVILASVGYYISALLIGLSYGTIFPAYNTMFVNLAHHNQRGTASSTYMTSWDVGIGIGLFLGGHVSQRVGFPSIYILGAFLGLISYVLSTKIAAPYFHQHKLR